MSKAKRIVDKKEPGDTELLAMKMASDIYPEILRTMIQLSDRDVRGMFETANVSFSYSKHDGSLSINPIVNNYSGGRGSVSVMKNLRPLLICPLFELNYYTSTQYIEICEASLIILRDLRKRKLKISNLIDRINSIPFELNRFVITEKAINIC